MNPVANLPFILQALGKGSGAYVQGYQQMDQHQKLMQDMEMMREREARESQLFPLQLQQMQDEHRARTDQFNPDPDMTGYLNSTFKAGLNPSMPKGDVRALLPAILGKNRSDAITAYRNQRKAGVQSYKAQQYDENQLKAARGELRRLEAAYDAANRFANSRNVQDPKKAAADAGQKKGQLMVQRALVGHMERNYQSKYGTLPVPDTTPANVLGGLPSMDVLDPSVYDEPDTTDDTATESEENQ